MKNLAEIDVYKDADLIVQTVGICNKRCSGCYLSKFPIKILDQKVYLNNLDLLSKDNIVVLRGGEISMAQNWFELFVLPAINSDFQVIIETNGYFVGRNGYNEVLSKLSHENLSVRISFDDMHNPAPQDFVNMAIFAKDAIKNNISFGFYSLAMNRNQIHRFLKGTELEKFEKYFHFLLKYKDISRIKLKGKYLRVDGEVFNKIVS